MCNEESLQRCFTIFTFTQPQHYVHMYIPPDNCYEIMLIGYAHRDIQQTAAAVTTLAAAAARVVGGFWPLARFVTQISHLSAWIIGFAGINLTLVSGVTHILTHMYVYVCLYLKNIICHLIAAQVFVGTIIISLNSYSLLTFFIAINYKFSEILWVERNLVKFLIKLYECKNNQQLINIYRQN